MSEAIGVGALFDNDKQGVGTRPDYQGDVTISGTKFRIVGWKRQGKTKPYISLSISEIKST